MHARLFLVTTAALIPFASIRAQTPMPVIVPAATTMAPAPAAVAAENAAADQAVIAALRQIKAANDETLKKQSATLEQLDEIEKAAEQIKIYSKRG